MYEFSSGLYNEVCDIMAGVACPPPTIVKMIQGLRIPTIFTSAWCPESKISNPFFKRYGIINTILDKNECFGTRGFGSRIYVSDISDPKERLLSSTLPIFNLKRLNKYLLVSKFSQINALYILFLWLNIQKIPAFLQPCDWLLKMICQMLTSMYQSQKRTDIFCA